MLPPPPRLTYMHLHTFIPPASHRQPPASHLQQVHWGINMKCIRRLCCSWLGIYLLLVSQLVKTTQAHQFLHPGRKPVIYLPDVCGYTRFEGLSRVIVHSHHEGEYLPNLDCEIHIAVSPDHVVRIQFHRFDMEPSVGGQCRDFVQFFNGMGTELVLTEPLCGRTVPKDVISNTSHITLRFRTDASLQNSGFTFMYEKLHKSKFHELQRLQTEELLRIANDKPHPRDLSPPVTEEDIKKKKDHTKSKRPET